MRVVRPTEFCSVPRVYEKFESSILDKISKRSPNFKSLFVWAQQKGLQNTMA